MKYKLPYGNKYVELRIDNSNINVSIINPKDVKPAENYLELLEKALENPINSKPFSEIISRKNKKIIFVIDDYTRKFPNKLIIPPILKMLKKAGVKNENVSFIMACGTHGEPTSDHLDDLFTINGEFILKDYALFCNNINNSDFVYLGKTSRGTPIEINKEYLDADIKILLTDVEYHYYAGFGGDRKSILPGVSSGNTISKNHALMIDPNSRTGNLKNNPVHLDMVEVAKKIGADFVVNVIKTVDNQIIDIKAGALHDAFMEAVKIYDQNYRIKLKSKADMIIISAGGYPKDINLYQALKGLEHCRPAVKDNGYIFFLAECIEGIGHKVFDEWMVKYNTLDKVKKQIQSNFKMGGHKVYYLLMAKSQTPNIYLYSELPKEEVVNKFQLKYIGNQNELNTKINNILKNEDIETVYIIPHSKDILIDSQ
ncbi:MAG: nickel-dependent lactate racemase [Candidatus Helarchaeota archaeon]